MTDATPVKLPDWKNPANYSHMQKSIIGREGLAWECLRRNLDYQKDWAALLCGTFVNENGVSASFCEANLIPKPKYKGFYSPMLLQNETPNEWLTRCMSKGRQPLFLSSSSYMGRQWQLNSDAVDPSLNAIQLKPLYLQKAHGSDKSPVPHITGLFSSKMGTYALRAMSDVREQIDRLDTEEVCGEELLSPENIVVILDATTSRKKNKSRLKAIIADAKKGLAPTPKSRNMDNLDKVIRVWDSEIKNPEMTRTERISIILRQDKVPSNQFSKRHNRARELIANKEYLRWFK